MTDPTRSRLRETRVQTLLEASPDALACLIRHGFAPLENPALRRALAGTVTLAQAVRLRGLSEADEDALLDDLAEICPCP